MYALNCIKIGTAIDPACGTAGFLVSAAEYIRSHYEDTMTEEQWQDFSTKTFTGYDTDQTIPCHRVVGTNGSLTGYAGGIDKKIKLLTLEKADLSRLFFRRTGYCCDLPIWQGDYSSVMSSFSEKT